jgi:DNA-binding transcriptional ArsR family regulator
VLRPGDYALAATVSDGGADRLRFAVSPVAVAVAAAVSWLEVPGWGPSPAWRAAVGARARGIDPRPLALYRDGVIPDCLVPLRLDQGADFHVELARMRATTPESLVAAIRHAARRDPLPPSLDVFHTDPARALEDYCRALAAFWDCAVDPYWQRMQRILEREILLAGRMLALEGLAAVLRGLHPDVSFEQGALRVRSRHRVNGHAVTAERPLVLLPFVSGADAVMLNDDHPAGTLIGYAARGSGELWGDPVPAPGVDLARLLGRTRARIALALWRSATTGDLAERLGLAPSTVSRHLSGLTACGLADRLRVGPHVYYRLTPRGERLLGLF